MTTIETQGRRLLVLEVPEGTKEMWVSAANNICFWNGVEPFHNNTHARNLGALKCSILFDTHNMKEEDVKDLVEVYHSMTNAPSDPSGYIKYGQPYLTLAENACDSLLSLLSSHGLDVSKRFVVLEIK